MGSGRGFAKSLGAGSGANSAKGTRVVEGLGRRGLRAGVFGAVVILLVAGFAVFGVSSRPAFQGAFAQFPTPPTPILSRTALPASVSQAKADARSVLGQLPLIFEPNRGQAESGVKFMARGEGYGLFLDPNGAMLALPSAPGSGSKPEEEFIGMRLVDANSNPEIAGADPLPGKTNYIIGNDPQQWHRGIPQFAGVRYRQVYPGVDLIFYGHRGHLEYDFRVAPRADASQAQLQFDGASILRVRNGDLLVARRNGTRKNNINESQQAILRLRAPQIYQQNGDRRTPIAGRFILHAGNRVSFEVASYDHQRELVIDPVLDFSTYFGGSGSEASTLGPSVAVNGDGFIYLAGTTTSPPASFPLNGATPATIGTTSNVFVAKINPSSPPVVVYATFLGGNGTDTSTGVAADAGGNTYLVGNTTSSNFPTTSLAYQTSAMAKGSQCSGATCTSIFISVLEASGAAQTYASYLSGNGNDVSTGMTIDTVQDVFVTGSTTSNDAASTTVAFPATNLPVPFQSASLASVQFFATKVNTRVPGVGGIAYSTYFGGNTPGGAIATGGGIAVDSIGNMYFTGTTNFYNSGSGLYGNSGTSGDFPILNAYQPCLDTVPPTTQPTTANPCSPPTTTPYPTDGFLAKINPLAQAGAQLLFSTYFGGTLADSSPSVTVDAGAANVYITGTTDSPDFLLPTGGTQGYQTCLNTPGTIVTVTSACPATTTNTDAFVARFTNPSVSTTGTPNFLLLTYFSYLGGGGNETGLSIAVDTASDALFTGSTNSGTANPPTLPTTTGAIQTALNGTQNAFFAHLNTAATATTQIGNYVTYFGGNGVDRGTSIAVDPSLNTYFAGDTTSTNLQVDDPLPGAGGTTLNGTTDDFVVKLGTAAQLCITCVAPVVSPTGSVGAGSPVTVTFTVVNNGPDVATSITVVGQVPNGVAIASGSVQSGSGTCSAPSGTNGVDIICQIPTLQAGSLANVVFNISATLPGTYEMTAIASSPNNTNTNSTTTAAFTATGFTLSVAPSAQTVAAGQAAQYSVVVAPTQGVFGANVSLACSSLPTGTSCNFTSSTITLSNGQGSGSTILNLTTTAQPVNTASTRWRGPLLALWLTVPGMAFLSLGANRKRRRNWLLSLFTLTAFFALTLLLPACSSNKTQPTVSGTPSGTYPMTVTATSGTYTKTAPFSVTVTP
jgi:uncharacterized repeat protein (TIGR01451 family)